MNLYGSMKMKNGILYIGEVSAVDLAKIYGTPLYVYDEKYLRDTLGKCSDISHAARGNSEINFVMNDKLDYYLINIVFSEGLKICADPRSTMESGIDIGSLLEDKDEYEVLKIVTEAQNMSKPLYVGKNIFDNSIVEIHSNEHTEQEERMPAVISVIDGKSTLIKSR